jgi:hypothetical protein
MRNYITTRKEYNLTYQEEGRYQQAVFRKTDRETDFLTGFQASRLAIPQSGWYFLAECN